MILVKKLAQTPVFIEGVGNLARRLEQTTVNTIAGNDVLVQESLLAKIGQLRTELEGPNPSVPEKLLVDRIVVIYLQLHHAELTAPEMDHPSAPRHQRQIERFQRRYESSIRTLMVVRKLARPIVIGQVNIAQRQKVVQASN